MDIHTRAADTAVAIAEEFGSLPASERANAQRAAFHLFVLASGMAKRSETEDPSLNEAAARAEEAMSRIGEMADRGVSDD